MSSWDDDDDTAAAAATDVELLKRAWRNEKAAPEILRFDSPLVSRVREQIQLLVRFSLSDLFAASAARVTDYGSGSDGGSLSRCRVVSRRRRSTTSPTAASTTWWSRSTRWTSTARSSSSAPTSASACRRLVVTVLHNPPLMFVRALRCLN
jgi:GINS complex subunit 4